MATLADSAPRVAKESSYSGLVLPISMFGIAILLFLTLDTKVAAPDFTLSHFLALGGILFIAGLMSGLCGFGFAAPGALSLFLLPPVTAIPMLQGLSACNQMMSISKLHKDMPKTLRQWFPHGPGPVILGGLFGVPVGVWLLNNLPGPTITLIIASLIIFYSVYGLFKPTGFKIHAFVGAPSGAAVGALGAVIGGFTAQPGMAVIVWTGLRDMSKAANRAMVQPFILTMQLVALITNGIQHPANFGARFWIMLALTVPVVLPGTLTGVWLYHRLSDLDFKRASYTLLGLGGVALIVRTLS